jgi:anti-sigma factor RsiW
LYEYVEGSLSADIQAAADEHLVRCSACRQAVAREQQCAQFLLNRLRQDTETLALCPEIRRRILMSSKSEPAAPPAQRFIIGFWNRLALPLGMAASLLVIAAILLINHFPGARVDDSEASSAVSVQLSYRVPTFKFRREGNLVVDTLSYETVVASGTLRPGGQESVPQTQSTKSPL